MIRLTVWRRKKTKSRLVIKQPSHLPKAKPPGRGWIQMTEKIVTDDGRDEGELV